MCFAGKPAKVFDRDEKLAGAHILGYKISHDEKWMSVYGIKKGATGSVDGCMPC